MSETTAIRRGASSFADDSATWVTSSERGSMKNASTPIAPMEHRYAGGGDRRMEEDRKGRQPHDAERVRAGDRSHEEGCQRRRKRPRHGDGPALTHSPEN